MSLATQQSDPQLHEITLQLLRKFHCDGAFGDRHTVHEMYDLCRRFALASKRDLKVAEDRLRKTLEWRRERAIDTLLDDSRQVCLPETEAFIAHCYPHGFHGIATGGRCVYVERTGLVDRSAISDHGIDLDELELHYSRIMERAYHMQWQAVLRGSHHASKSFSSVASPEQSVAQTPNSDGGLFALSTFALTSLGVLGVASGSKPSSGLPSGLSTLDQRSTAASASSSSQIPPTSSIASSSLPGRPAMSVLPGAPIANLTNAPNLTPPSLSSISLPSSPTLTGSIPAKSSDLPFLQPNFQKSQSECASSVLVPASMPTLTMRSRSSSQLDTISTFNSNTAVSESASSSSRSFSLHQRSPFLPSKIFSTNISSNAAGLPPHAPSHNHSSSASSSADDPAVIGWKKTLELQKSSRRGSAATSSAFGISSTAATAALSSTAPRFPLVAPSSISFSRSAILPRDNSSSASAEHIPPPLALNSSSSPAQSQSISPLSDSAHAQSTLSISEKNDSKNSSELVLPVIMSSQSFPVSLVLSPRRLATFDTLNQTDIEFLEIPSLPIVFIFDLEGLGFTDLTSCISYFKRIIHTMQTYYPQSLFKMFILNAAFFFESVWAVVKPFIDRDSAAKIEVLGSKLHDKLADAIPSLSQIPTFLEGKCNSCGANGCLPVLWKMGKFPKS